MQTRSGFSRRSLFLFGALFVAGLVATASAYTLWRLRSEAIDHHFDAARAYARTFEEHLTQTFNVIDLTLTSLAAEGRSGEAAFTVALRHAPYLRSLSALDERGAITVSTHRGNLGIRIARDAFLPPAREPAAILRIGPPWVGRDFHDGRAASAERPELAEAQSLLPAMRDTGAEPRPGPSLLAAVNTDYFLNYYGRSISAEAGVVELLRYDGTLLLSSDANRKLGIRVGDRAFVDRVTADEIGAFEQRLEDGRAVLTAYRASRAYPLVVVVHLDKNTGLAAWSREAMATLAAVTVVLLLALGLASLYFVRVERAARQHDADMQQLRLRGAALEAADNAMLITDRQGRIEWVNPAFCAMSGYALAEVVGRNPRDLVKSGAQAPAAYGELWQTILAGKVWRGEIVNRRKDGTCYPEDQTITPVLDQDGAISHFIAVKQDITQRKRGEADLRISNTQLSALIEAIPDAIFLKDAESRWMIVNEAAKQLFRLHDIPWQTKTGEELAELQPELRATHEKCLVDDELAWEAARLTLFSEAVPGADGSIHDYEVRKMPVFDEAGRRQSLVILGRNVTETKRAEEALHESEARLQATLDAIPDLLFEFGLDGRYHAYHTARVDLLAVPPEKFLGRRVAEVLPEQAAAAVMAALREAHETGGSTGRQIKLVLPQGEMWFELSAARKSTPPDKDPRFILLSRDITERKRGEERMAEMSRHLVTVQESARRRLSGELHERTSPNLAAIEVNLDIVAGLLDARSPDVAERLADVRALIEDTSASIREISSDLRPPVLDYGGLLEALNSYVRQFQRRTGILVRIDCAPTGVRLAPTLESVLFRLVQEALTNCAKHSRAKSVTVTLRLAAPLVTLTVSDDGGGFDPATLGETTHTRGLGILIMREMTEFSGGRFGIESAPGVGTRVGAEIPCGEDGK